MAEDVQHAWVQLVKLQKRVKSPPDVVLMLIQLTLNLLEVERRSDGSVLKKILYCIKL